MSAFPLLAEEDEANVLVCRSIDEKPAPEITLDAPAEKN